MLQEDEPGRGMSGGMKGGENGHWEIPGHDDVCYFHNLKAKMHSQFSRTEVRAQTPIRPSDYKFWVYCFSGYIMAEPVRRF